jgi:ketosteroid isomerase-like protein
MSQEGVDIVTRCYDAFRRRDFEAALAFFDPEAEWRPLPMMPDQGPFHGHEGVRRFWEGWLETFQDFEAVVDEIIDSDDHVVVMARVRGRGTDSGASVEAPRFATVWTVGEGRITRVVMYTTKTDALTAAGMPAEA